MEIPLNATNHSNTPTRRHGDVEQLIQPTDRCAVCGDTAGDLSSRLNRFGLPIQMTLASVFAERDLCAACCNNFGRAMWAETKRGLAQRTLAEQAPRHSKRPFHISNPCLGNFHSHCEGICDCRCHKTSDGIGA